MVYGNLQVLSWIISNFKYLMFVTGISLLSFYHKECLGRIVLCLLTAVLLRNGNVISDYFVNVN